VTIINWNWLKILKRNIVIATGHKHFIGGQVFEEKLVSSGDLIYLKIKLNEENFIIITILKKSKCKSNSININILIYWLYDQ
jgi:hypothetical protein